MPPEPVHVTVKPAEAVRTPVLRLPLAGSEPLQLPDAVHELAFAELHVSVVELPLSMLVLAALNDAVGMGSPGEVVPPQADNSADTPSTQDDSNKRMGYRVSFFLRLS